MTDKTDTQKITETNTGFSRVQQTVRHEFICNTCGKIYPDDKILKALNPFDATEEILGCPFCYAINSFVLVCDEPGCDKPVCCGYNTENGYRQTCSIHARAV